MTTFLMVATLLLSGCGGGATGAGRSEEMKRLRRECSDAMMRWDCARQDSLTQIYYQRASAAGDRHNLAYAHYFLGSFRQNIPASQADRREAHLRKAQEMAEAENNTLLLSSVYNSRGLWELGRRRHYYKAQYWLGKAMETARREGDRVMEVSAEMNLSELCRTLGDTLGYKYDKDLFDYARQTGNTSLLLSSGFHCALYHVRTAKTLADLAPYIDAMRKSGEKHVFITFTHAQFYYLHGQYGRALGYLASVPKEQLKDASIICLYAKILSATGQPGKADEWIRRGLTAYTPADYDRFAVDMMRTLAANLHAAGKDGEAYEWLNRCKAAQDSIARVRQTDQTDRFKIAYGVAKKDAELQAQRRHTATILWASAIIISLLTLIIAGLVVYYAKRRRLYRSIVSTHLDALASARTAEEARGAQQLSPEKADELFARITEQMDRREVWRDTTITRERFAERIGCNRTYFSAALKLKTGLSYAQFMNKRRVDEAIRLLSDPADQTPLKQLAADLGFLTAATFCTAFKKATGLSPAAYRTTAADLSRKQGAEDE